MGLLSDKRQKARDDEVRFAASSKRSAFLSVIVLMLITAIIALIGLALFYTLNCQRGVDYLDRRPKLAERYSLVPSELGGCVGTPRPLYNSSLGPSYSVLYMIGDGQVKPWQYVGHSPLFLHFHDGGNLIVYLWGEEGNMTEKTLGPEGHLVIQLPPFHWHAWKPENLSPLVILSVLTPPGTPDFSQRPVTEFGRDPLLRRFENETMLQRLSKSVTADYCSKVA